MRTHLLLQCMISILIGYYSDKYSFMGNCWLQKCMCSWFLPNRRKKTCPDCRDVVRLMPASSFVVHMHFLCSVLCFLSLLMELTY